MALGAARRLVVSVEKRKKTQAGACAFTGGMKCALRIAGVWLVFGGLGHFFGVSLAMWKAGAAMTAEHRIYLVMIGLVQLAAGSLHLLSRRAMVAGETAWRSMETAACGLMIVWGAVETPHVLDHAPPFNLGAPSYFLAHVALALATWRAAGP
jgi:hypothetical protein